MTAWEWIRTGRPCCGSPVESRPISTAERPVDSAIQRVFVAGTPDSQPVLATIAASLATAGLEVVEHYGPPTEDLRLVAGWQAAQVALCYMIPCGREVLRAAPGLRAVVAPTLGCDWIDL